MGDPRRRTIAARPRPAAETPRVVLPDLSVFVSPGQDPTIGLDRGQADAAMAREAERERAAAEIERQRASAGAVLDLYQEGIDAGDMRMGTAQLPPALGGADPSAADAEERRLLDLLAQGGGLPFAGSFPGSTASTGATEQGAHAVAPGLDPAVTLPSSLSEEQTRAAMLQVPHGIPAAPTAPPASAAPSGGARSVVDFVGGAGGSAPRGGSGGGARPAPARPPTEQEINDAYIAALTNRPEGEAPLFGEDFRPESTEEAQARLTADAARLGQQRAEQQGIAAAERQDVAAAAQEQRARIAAEREAALTDARSRYQNALARVGQMRVDPQRWWSDVGFAGSAAAAVAMALGSVGEALGGGANHAVELIQNAVRADVEAQQVNLAAARDNAESQRGIIGLVRDEYDDAEAAQAAAEALMLSQVEQQMAQQVAQLDNEAARLQGEEALRQLREARETAAATAEQRQFLATLELRRAIADTERAEARAMREQRRAMGGGAGALVGGMTREQRVYAVPGAVWDGTTLPGDSDRSTVRRWVGQTGAALTAVQDAIRLREQFGSETLDRDAVPRMREGREAIINSLRVIENTGVPQEHEMRRFEARVPDPSAFLSIDVLPSLRALEERMQATAGAAIRPYGYELDTAGRRRSEALAESGAERVTE